MHLNYPKTIDEWWDNCEKSWKLLKPILIKYGGYTEQELEKMKADKDPKLSLYYQTAWFKLPDIPAIHSIPGFSILCDLCSESHVLYTKEETE